APPSLALSCRWRSRPQHQQRTHAPQPRAYARSGATVGWGILPKPSRRRARSIHAVAARRLDTLLQCGDPDGPENHFVADDIAGGAVDAHGAGELHVLAERGADLVAGSVLLEPNHVEALILGRSERLLLARRPATTEQFLMESEIFLPLGILHADRNRDARRLRRTGAQDRKLLEHDLQIRIVLDQRQHVGQRPFAKAAAIIEEFNEGDIAVRIAER